MGPFADVPLASFLGCARGDWRPRERQAVQRKLAAIGVEEVDALLRCIHDGSLNEKLENIGEKRFTAETLGAMRSAAVQLSLPYGLSGLDKDFPEELSSDEDLSDILPAVPPTLRPPLRATRQVLPRGPGATATLPEKPGSCGATGKSAAFPSGSLSGGGSRTSALDFDFLDSSCLFADDLDLSSRPFTGTSSSSRPFTGGSSRPFTGSSATASLGRWMASRRLDADEEDAAMLRRDICRGLNQVDAVAAEAKRRNGEVARCLAEVQADIVRITERMVAARQRHDQRSRSCQDPSGGGASSSTFNPSSQAHGVTAPPSPKRGGRPRPTVGEMPNKPTPPPGTVPPQTASRFAPSSLGQATSMPRRPDSEHRQRRQPSQLRGGNPPSTRPAKEAKSTRGMESGFTFGGATGKQQQQQQRQGTQDHRADPASQAQEAVRNQLLAVRGCPEADRKACVKRLLVKWHPDRNPESTEVATSVFQYIQQEKERILDM